MMISERYEYRHVNIAVTLSSSEIYDCHEDRTGSILVTVIWGGVLGAGGKGGSGLYIYICMHIYIYIYIHSFIHSFIRSFIHSFTHTHTHMCRYTDKQIYVFRAMFTYKQLQMYTHMCLITAHASMHIQPTLFTTHTYT